MTVSKGWLWICGAAVLAPAPAIAEPSPWPVHRLCGEADAIVLGERIGAARVRVDEWLRPPAGGRIPPPEIEIAGLEDHLRRVTRRGRERTHESLKTQRLLCFLERKGAAWYSMIPLTTGSSGLIWIESPHCYRYRQIGDPGPCILTPDRDCPTETQLRKQVAKGLADRRAWEDALRISHPEEKAIVLASYLLTRTSPEREQGTFLPRVRQFLPQLGSAAVREVVEILRTARPGDRLDEAVLVLNDLGPAARPAVPLLLPLLKRPGQVHPARVLAALGRIGDATVAHEVLPLLAHEELQVRCEAAKALAAFRYEDAAIQIAECLPEQVQEEDAYYLYSTLIALMDLDAGRAAQLTKRYIDLPAMKQVRDLLTPLLQLDGS